MQGGRAGYRLASEAILATSRAQPFVASRDQVAPWLLHLSGLRWDLGVPAGIQVRLGRQPSASLHPRVVSFHPELTIRSTVSSPMKETPPPPTPPNQRQPGQRGLQLPPLTN